MLPDLSADFARGEVFGVNIRVRHMAGDGPNHVLEIAGWYALSRSHIGHIGSGHGARHGAGVGSVVRTGRRIGRPIPEIAAQEDRDVAADLRRPDVNMRLEHRARQVIVGQRVGKRVVIVDGGSESAGRIRYRCWRRDFLQVSLALRWLVSAA